MQGDVLNSIYSSGAICPNTTEPVFRFPMNELESFMIRSRSSPSVSPRIAARVASKIPTLLCHVSSTARWTPSRDVMDPRLFATMPRLLERYTRSGKIIRVVDAIKVVI